MRLHTLFKAGLAALALSHAMADAATPRAPDARTIAAVEAADKAWAAAEEAGDAAFIDWLLLPGYRSVGTTGVTTDKAAIVAYTKARSEPALREAHAARVAAWKRDHPNRSDVVIYDGTAILTWISTSEESRGRVQSSDVFVYREGHWHGIYSQATVL